MSEDVPNPFAGQFRVERGNYAAFVLIRSLGDGREAAEAFQSATALANELTEQARQWDADGGDK